MTADPPPRAWSRLDDRVLLADASQALAMVSAGADLLIDLRAETTPPRLPAVIEHHPIEELVPGQDDLILAAARRVLELAGHGLTVGIYCQAGMSRTSAVAIAYLLLRGMPLTEASTRLRTARPTHTVYQIFFRKTRDGTRASGARARGLRRQATFRTMPRPPRCSCSSSCSCCDGAVREGRPSRLAPAAPPQCRLGGRRGQEAGRGQEGRGGSLPCACSPAVAPGPRPSAHCILAIISDRARGGT
jgi:hypothetical protein